MKTVIAKGMGQVLQKLEFAFPGNIKPRAFNGKMTTTLNTPTMINPNMLAFDANGDPPRAARSRGGAPLQESFVRYSPPASKPIDGFVYRVGDGKGRSNVGIVRVKVN